MKARLLFILALLVAGVSRGAIPSYNGTTHVISPTNLLKSNFVDSATVTWVMGANGRLTATAIGATGSNVVNNFNGIATNLTIYSNLVIQGSSSNALAYMTNVCVETDNTNEIYVLSGGSAPGNGKYVLKSSVDPTIIWTNVNGYGIVFDTDIGSPWDMTNAAGGLQYSKVATALESGTWVNTGGTNPVPTTLYGTNTTCREYLFISGVPYPYDNIRHVKTNSFASDITAVKGDPGLPHATVTNAIARASPNEIVLVWPGVHNWGASDMAMSNGVKLIGFGRGVSVITNAVGVNRYLELGNNSVIEGISATFVPSSGQVSAGAKTNWSIINCDFEGASDGLLMPAWQGPVRLLNSRFASGFDGIADNQTAAVGSGTNTDLYIIGCEIAAIESGAGVPARGLVLNSAKAKIVGSTILARNGASGTPSTTPIVIPTTATNVASIHLVGTSLFYDSTNGGIVMAISNGNPNVVVRGQWTENGTNVMGNTLNVLAGGVNVAGSVAATNMTATNRVITGLKTLAYVGTNVTVDWSQGNHFALLMTNNAKLWFTNGPGATWSQTGLIDIRQDGTGSRLLYWDSTNIETNTSGMVLSTAANSKDKLYVSTDHTGTNFQTLLNIGFLK